MSTELAQLFPIGKQISINEENLTIKPFKFGELPRVFKCIEPITGVLAQMLASGEVNAGSIAGLVANGGDSILDLIALGTKKPRGWVDQLEMDQGVELLVSIFEVNADFFTQKVLPTLNQKMEKTVGQTSS